MRETTEAPPSTAVRRPVPGFLGEVPQSESSGVARKPPVAGVRAARDQTPVVGEIDGETLFVHRPTRPSRWRAALRRRHLVHGVVRGAAVRAPYLNLRLGIPITAAASIATKDDGHLLGVHAQSPILVVEQMTTDPSGRRIKLSQHRYPAHRMHPGGSHRGRLGNGGAAGTSTPFRGRRRMTGASPRQRSRNEAVGGGDAADASSRSATHDVGEDASGCPRKGRT